MLILCLIGPLGIEFLTVKQFCFPEIPGEFYDQVVKVSDLVFNLECMPESDCVPGYVPGIQEMAPVLRSQCRLDRNSLGPLQPTDAFCLGCIVPLFKN